jgi:hypothetical protein
MPFPSKRSPDAPPTEKKPRKFTKNGTMVGCERVLGPERMEVSGQQVDVEVQMSRRAKSSLVQLARSALLQPDGVKSVRGGLFRVVVRPVQD